MIKNYTTMKLNIKKGAGIALFAVALLGGTTVNAQLTSDNSIKLQIEEGDLENQVNALTLTRANFTVIKINETDPNAWDVTLEERDFTPMEGSEGGYARFVNVGSKVTLEIEVEEEGYYQMTARFAYGVGELPFIEGEDPLVNGQIGTQVLWPGSGGTGEIFKGTEDGRFQPYVTSDEGTWKTKTWEAAIEFKEGTNVIEIWKFYSNASLDYIIIGDPDYLSTEDQDMNAFNLYPNPVTNGMVNIDLVDFSAKSINYSIFTLDGRMVKSNNLEISNNKLNFSVSELNSGTYILKAEAGNKSFAQKLVIQ